MGRNKVWLIPLLLLVTFPLWKIPLASFLTPRGQYNPTTKQEKREQQLTMNDALLRQFKGTKLESQFRAKQVKSGDKPKTFILTKVSGDILGKETTTIHAKAGEYNQAKNLLTLTGDVVVEKAASKQKLLSQKLIHNETKGTLFSPGRATVISEGNIIKGGSLLYHINSQQYQFGKRVYTTITPK